MPYTAATVTREWHSGGCQVYRSLRRRTILVLWKLCPRPQILTYHPDPFLGARSPLLAIEPKLPELSLGIEVQESIG